jgi:hypothetical protein
MPDGLRLPAQVTLQRVSLAGPFAHGTLSVAPARVPLQNATTAPVTVASTNLAPIVGDASGLAPAFGSGALTATVGKQVLDPGEATMIEIAGRVPARPGSYLTQLDVAADTGASASAPLRINVAASAVWGIGCMLFGLMLLGLLRLLSGEGDVQETARAAARARGELHSWLQREPPPLSRADAVAEIDRNLDEAARALARPRPLSVVDRRIQDATAALAAAHAAAAKLRDKLDAYPPGAAEVDDLTKDWGALQERMRRLAAPDAAGSGPVDGLAAHATILLGRARAQLVDLPLQWIAADLGPQLDRVRLAQLAGETDRARAMALSTRAWMRRAADDLERRLTLMMGLNLSSNGMIVSDAWVRRIAAGEELPPEQRAALLDRLAAADAVLAAGVTLADLAAAARDVGATETEATRDRAEVLKARVRRIAEAAGDEMSTDPMDAVMHEASLVAHPTVEQKAAALGQMLEVWRGRLGVVHDTAARTRMAAEIDAAEAAAGRRELAAVPPALHALQNEWQAYLPKHIAAAVAAAVAAVCRDWRDRYLQQLVETTNEVKLQSGHLEVVDWERRLDRARRGLQAVAPESATSPDDCLGPVGANGAEVIAVSQEAFTRAMTDVPIPLQTRLDAAQTSGTAAAIASVQRLMSEPRDLKLAVVTPEAELVAGGPVLFTLRDLDQNWRSGVGVQVDWGDGSPPLRTDAEQLLQGQRLEHRYATVGTVHPTVIAANHFNAVIEDAVAAADGPELGRSSTDLFVQQSPATTAERLADIFLTSQFGLALLIASVVYFWRYHAGPRVFGTSGFHYVEAFALGFAAYAAVSDMPKMLADLSFK